MLLGPQGSVLAPRIGGPPSRRVREPWHADRVIAGQARRQEGYVARRHLLAAGLTAKQVDRRVQSGHLHPSFHGVYAVGQRALAPGAIRWAVLLACGDGAILAGATAAVHRGLLPERRRPPHHVIVTTAHAPRRPAVVAHRIALHPTEVGLHQGAPCGTVPRLLLDVAAWDGRAVAERVWREAIAAGLLDHEAVGALLERRPGARGGRTLAGLLDRRLELVGRSETALERRVLVAARDAGLPEPELNARRRLPDGRRVRFDLLFPTLGLVVEADGPYHDDPEVRADDVARDAATRAAGLDVVRLPHHLPTAAMAARLATWSAAHRPPAAARR